MRERWWFISGPRWTFAICSRDDVVVEAAPISQWAIGKPLHVVLDWWLAKGADDMRELKARDVGATYEIGLPNLGIGNKDQED